MKKRQFWLLGVFLWASIGGAISQDKQAIKYAKTITVTDLKARLSVLAHDSLEGRDTGSKGQKIAAQYIADHFSQIGLEPVVETSQGKSYFQSFELYKGTINEVYFRKGDDRKRNLVDFLYYSRSETFGEEFIKLVYLKNLSDLDIAIEGKYVVFDTDAIEWQKAVELLSERKPAGYIAINSKSKEFSFMLKRFENYFQRPAFRKSFDNSEDKILMINPEMMEWLFGKPTDKIAHGDDTQVIFNADMLNEPVSTENVLGYLKGSEKPDELVIVTSHYDHLGMINGEIYNGADDDGSGTTTLMEIAEAFALAAKKGQGPKRSMLFMCVTGEEKGLLGSSYYTENPVFPLENTVTNLNIDMVGRVDPKYEEAGNPNYIYVIGSDKLSQKLHDLSERVNATTEKLTLDYTYNDENDPNRFYYRSDHYNFAKNNIPIIFYFNGTHADYHKPTDTIEKINFDKMQKVGRLVYYTAWEVANQSDRITADKLD